MNQQNQRKAYLKERRRKGESPIRQQIESHTNSGHQYKIGRNDLVPTIYCAGKWKFFLKHDHLFHLKSVKKQHRDKNLNTNING